MGRPISASLRLEIYEAYKNQGLSYNALSVQYQLNYKTVRKICISFEEKGVSSLLPDYSSCGRRIDNETEKAFRLIRLIRYFHPQWGVPFIVTKVKHEFPQLPLQSIRNYQRRLKSEKSLELPRPKLPKSEASDAIQQAHDEWQIDANERIPLLNQKEQVCYLNITDTRSNAILKAKPFSLWSYQSS